MFISSEIDGSSMLFKSSASTQQAGKRTRKAFMQTLYREHAHNILKYLQRNYGSGPPEPEDVVQDVFAKFSEAEGVEQLINPKAYLYKMAINQTLNEMGRVKRINQYIGEQSSLTENDQSELTPEVITSNQHELAVIGKAVDKLSHKQREILIRSRIKGETYTQISAELGYSLADISRQLGAALLTLQQARAE